MARLSQFQGRVGQTNTQKQASEKDIKEKFDQYKDMSQAELNNTLFEEVARQKQAGTFDYDGLSRMVDSLKGALPPQDYENIKRLLESLR